jgi:transcriptional regulator with XRE-family HTH domain
MSVGALIGQRRRERRLTLQRVADMVGCAKSYLWQIEQGRRANPPSVELLERLERALGMTAGSLVRVAEWASTPAPVRERLSELEVEQKVAQRLAEILAESGIDDGGKVGGALDRAHRSGELRRLVERIAPEKRGSSLGGSEGRVAPPVVRELPMEVPLINQVAAGYPREFTDLGYPARVAGEYVRTPDVSDPDAFAARVVGDSMLPEYREGDIVVFSPARLVVSGMDCFARLEPDHETTFKRAYFEKDERGEELIRLQPLNPAFASRTLPREHVAGLYAAVSVTRKIGVQ